VTEDEMNKISEPVREIALPKPDGAPYNCRAFVPASRPIYWQDCSRVATKAYMGMKTNKKYLRCPKHYPTTTGV
jgi:hypothetical protein